jgi:hypothetical protein
MRRVSVEIGVTQESEKAWRLRRGRLGFVGSASAIFKAIPSSNFGLTLQ